MAGLFMGGTGGTGLRQVETGGREFYDRAWAINDPASAIDRGWVIDCLSRS